MMKTLIYHDFRNDRYYYFCNLSKENIKQKEITFNIIYEKDLSTQEIDILNKIVPSFRGTKDNLLKLIEEKLNE